MTSDFRIGDKVVYPNHGVGTIEQISSRSSVSGQAEHYYLLRINSNQTSLTVTVPFHNVESVGLRKIVKQAEIGKILVYLADGDCRSHSDWKWRFKENSEKMRSGSLLQVAEVMKSLLKLGRNKPLSFREKKMLDRSRYLLVSELATVKGMPERTAEALIDKSLAKSKLKLPDQDIS
jgi:CarD family transcriptional regulator